MGYRALAVIIAGFSTVFVAFGIRYSYGLLLPKMLSDLAISKTGAGAVYSSYFFAYTVCSPLLGLLADRLDVRAILTIFVAVLGVAAYLMSLSNSVVQASIFFALAGIGHSACWAPVVTVVMRWVSEKRRGIALSMVDLGSATTIAFWSVMIPLIIGAYSWRMVWASLGLAAFLVAGMNFFLVRSHPPFEMEPQGTGSASKARIQIKAAYTAILRNKKFYLIGFSYLLISFSILIPFVFLTAYATQELKISYASAAGLVAVIGVAGAIGKLVLGHISDVVGRIKVMMLCGVLAAVGGLGLAYAQNFIMLILFTSVFGVGFGAIWPVYAASARDLFSKDYSGSIVGLWTVCHGLGSILAPVFAGWAIDTTGTYVWAFMLTVISGAISSLLLLPLRNPG
jgi:OFA family oxalate/formate antiporter-like MFS transporter